MIRASAQTRSPSAMISTSPGTSSRRRDLGDGRRRGPPGPGSRQERGQRLDRPFGLPLLHERERGVEQDHRDDRDRQRRIPPAQASTAASPQQHRQRLGELREQLRPASAGPGPGQLVRAVRQPAGARPPGRPTRREVRRSRNSRATGSRGSALRPACSAGATAVGGAGLDGERPEAVVTELLLGASPAVRAGGRLAVDRCPRRSSGRRTPGRGDGPHGQGRCARPEPALRSRPRGYAPVVARW